MKRVVFYLLLSIICWCDCKASDLQDYRDLFAAQMHLPSDEVVVKNVTDSVARKYGKRVQLVLDFMPKENSNSFYIQSFAVADSSLIFQGGLLDKLEQAALDSKSMTKVDLGENGVLFYGLVGFGPGGESHKAYYKRPNGMAAEYTVSIAYESPLEESEDNFAYRKLIRNPSSEKLYDSMNRMLLGAVDLHLQLSSPKSEAVTESASQSRVLEEVPTPVLAPEPIIEQMEAEIAPEPVSLAGTEEPQRDNRLLCILLVVAIFGGLAFVLCRKKERRERE